jgi:hypothetical protein
LCRHFLERREREELAPNTGAPLPASQVSADAYGGVGCPAIRTSGL